MIENKRERFVRIAEARTTKIIDMIRLLGNCSNKKNYDFTEKDVTTIFATIERELKNTKQKFVASENKQTKFKLEK
ncbi:MAG: hypothetical protein PHS54_06705 [Clostridia bacterium]|nr:hypothetical protein [Clostridia bacterium]